LIIAVLAALAGACANHGKLRDIELARIGEWLPGEYDNSAQVHEDLAAGKSGQSPSLRLNIVPLSAPFIGRTVLFVQTIDATDGRVLSQQLFRFEKSADEKSIVQRTFEFKEPRRWSGGAAQTEIFASLMGEDVTATPACDLVWTFDGEWFTGVAGRKGCPVRSLEFDGLELKIDQAGRPAGDVIRYRRVGAD